MPTPPTPPAQIELRLTQIAQLFNSLDPSPFYLRDIDDDAEQYIVGWAGELPAGAPLAVRIYLPEAEAHAAEVSGVDAVFCNYFSDRAQATAREMKELFRSGRRYLLISLPLLALCLTASQFVHASFAEGALTQIVEESLVILGWVANWKPLETFLYDWQPIRRRMRLYRRLASADVKIEVG